MVNCGIFGFRGSAEDCGESSAGEGSSGSRRGFPPEKRSA